MRIRDITKRRFRVEFRKLRKVSNAHGTIDYDEAGPRIVIDLHSRIAPAKVLLHELLHLEHGDWPESRVVQEENRIWRRLSTGERAVLYRAMMRRALKIPSVSS